MGFLFWSAAQNLVRNKVRTMLTSLGILVGVLSVVLLVAFGTGLRDFVQGQFDDLGANILIVFPGQILNDEGGFQDSEGGVGSTEFTENDVVELERLRNAEHVVPAFLVPGNLSTQQGETLTTSVVGTVPGKFTIRNFVAEYGELFTTSDVRKRAKVVVLGQKMAENLYGSPEAAIGESLRINDLRFEVIGVLNLKGTGQFGGPDFDSYVFIPYSAGGSLNPKGTFFVIWVQARSEDVVAILKDQIAEVMLDRLEEDDFSVIEQTEIQEVVTTIFAVMNGILVALGSISLVVGGVGIMNIMYAAVNERIKEIGIRRALGATKRDILLQFVTESALVSMVGGLLALILSYGLQYVVRQFNIPVSIDLLSVVLALGVSGGIGVIFGVFPARRAAGLPPIEAIRGK